LWNPVEDLVNPLQALSESDDKNLFRGCCQSKLGIWLGSGRNLICQSPPAPAQKISDAELIALLFQAQHEIEAQGRPNEAPVLLADFAKELLNQRLSASVQVVQWIDLRRLNYRAQLDKFAIALASRMDMNRHTLTNLSLPSRGY
jgi:hypothetical protein